LVPSCRASHPNANDELHEQDSADQMFARDVDLGAKDGGHSDNGANAIVIEPEGKQEFEQLLVLANLTKGVSQSLEAGAHGVGALPAHYRRRGFGHVAEEGYGEQSPPHVNVLWFGHVGQ